MFLWMLFMHDFRPTVHVGFLLSTEVDAGGQRSLPLQRSILDTSTS
jgi:hypothetical protein